MERIIIISISLIALILCDNAYCQKVITLLYDVNDEDTGRIVFPPADMVDNKTLNYNSNSYNQFICGDTLTLCFDDIHNVSVKRGQILYTSLKQKIISSVFIQKMEVYSSPSFIHVESSNWHYFFREKKRGHYHLINYYNNNKNQDSVIIEYTFKKVVVLRKDYPKLLYSIFLYNNNNNLNSVYDDIDTVIWKDGEMFHQINYIDSNQNNQMKYFCIASSSCSYDKMFLLEKKLNNSEINEYKYSTRIIYPTM